MPPPAPPSPLCNSSVALWSQETRSSAQPKGRPMFHPLNKSATRLALVIALALSMAACSHGPDESAAPPAFTVENNQYKVPDTSPLRKELVVQPVEMHQAPHTMVFPANVEAD